MSLMVPLIVVALAFVLRPPMKKKWF